MSGLELTTVADDMIVFHDGVAAHRFDGLRPDTEYEFLGRTVRTMARPAGELLSTIATVNDVHYGEVECGRIDDHREGPIQRRSPDEEPHADLMNRCAVAEIDAANVSAVVVKGDLSTDGTAAEWAAFEATYRPPFDDRLHVVRGNHDAYRGQERYAGDRWIDLDGLTIGLLDTVIPEATPGTLTPDQLDRIDDELAARSDRRVVLMGHHQQWIAGIDDDGHRSENYFGIDPDASDALDAVCARHRNVVAYTAGHTHRHRRREMTVSGVPSIEIGCVKDFPGTWAEYRVFEGGVLQVVHRVSDPEALEWSERCRHLYADFGIDYEAYALSTLAHRCFPVPDRV